MFQPQATPYSNSFSSYGIGLSLGNFAPSFEPAGGGNGGSVSDHNRQSQTPHIAKSGSTLFLEAAAANHHLARGPLPPHFTSPNNNISNNLRHPAQYNKMSGHEHDVQAQTLAAENYERENRIEGPMVGEKRSSHAITEEYAKADPIYVTKTRALPQKYSDYRPIAGDGNCGWRAVGFSYFECLLQSQSRAQLLEELARITSLNNLLTTAGGFESWLVEDMTDELPRLLRDLAGVVETSPETATVILSERFNDQQASPNIIYHLRLLASSWLARDTTNYVGFIPDDLGVLGYRRNVLEPPNTEIDHLGMSLLIDVLLKPIGITAVIVYLDRSEGSQANSHIFQSEDSNGVPTNPDGPMIHLLYRPSHYDILYKEVVSAPDQQVMESMALHSNILVNRAHLNHHHHIQQSHPTMSDYSQGMDLNILLSIPGAYQTTQQPSLSGYQSHYASPIDQAYAHSPMSSSLSPTSPGTSIATPSSSIMSPTFSSQQTLPHSQSLASPNVHRPSHIPSFPGPGPTTQMPIHTHMPTPNTIPHRPSLSSNASMEMPSPVSTTSSFRPSKYEYTAAAEWQEPVVFQTSSFKNSHFNTAHYNNPHFQPEEWNPTDEEQSARKKSSA